MKNQSPNKSMDVGLPYPQTETQLKPNQTKQTNRQKNKNKWKQWNTRFYKSFFKSLKSRSLYGMHNLVKVLDKCNMFSYKAWDKLKYTW